MGSLIHLAVGDFKVDWGKNNNFMMHGSLFQPGDLGQIGYKYVGAAGEDIEEMKETAVRPLLSKMDGLTGVVL